MIAHDVEAPAIISTGVSGLDDVLAGGLTADRLYLVEGTPGTGKTTLALRFLLEGAARGERALHITLAETERELRSVAQSHGLSLDTIDIEEMVPADSFADDREQTLLHPSEVELGETLRVIMAKIDEIHPSRVVIDSLSELRLLAQTPVRYRRQILALKHFFSSRQCTVLLLDDQSAANQDLKLHSICHGVIALEQTLLGFGAQRRRLHVVKMRGVRFRGGYPDYEIERGGLRVFPRLVTGDRGAPFDTAQRSTGSTELDALLGGGLVPGTATLMLGPAGVGKTTTCVQAMVAALRRGEKAAYFLFDERQPTLLKRSAALGMALEPYLASGQLVIRVIDPAEISPGEFAHAVRLAVEEAGASVIVIDSLNAYLQSMPEEQHLMLQMHEMLSFLANHGVISLLILGMHGVIGDMRVDIDISYLADSVLQLRYFEADGEVRQAISVVKTRTAQHERTIREFQITRHGLEVGEPLRGFHGVLTGTPSFKGDSDTLMTNESETALAAAD